jgi:hypothetical protein
MTYIFVMFVSQKLAANQLSLSQTHQGDVVSEFVSKFVAKTSYWKRTFRDRNYDSVLQGSNSGRTGLFLSIGQHSYRLICHT